MFSFLRWSQTWSLLTAEWALLSQFPPSEPPAWGLCVEHQLVKAEAKMLSISVFSLSFFTSLPLLLTVLFWLMYLQDSFLFFFSSFAKSSSGWALAFLIPSLLSQQYLYTPLRLLVLAFTACAFSYCSPVWWTGSLVQPCLLFPNFLHVEMKSSWALRKASLNTCQLCYTPLSLRAISIAILLSNFLKS